MKSTEKEGCPMDRDRLASRMVYHHFNEVAQSLRQVRVVSWMQFCSGRVALNAVNLTSVPVLSETVLVLVLAIRRARVRNA